MTDLTDAQIDAEHAAAVAAVTSLCTSEVRVIPNCLCGEAIWRHVAEAGRCMSRACGCTKYRPKETQQ